MSIKNKEYDEIKAEYEDTERRFKNENSRLTKTQESFEVSNDYCLMTPPQKTAGALNYCYDNNFSDFSTRQALDNRQIFFPTLLIPRHSR